MSANVVDQLLELLRAGKDVVMIERAAGVRRELHGYLIARRQRGETHAASTRTYRTTRAAGGSIEIRETTSGLKGSSVDVVLFAGEPSRHDKNLALTAVSVRRGRVEELAA